MKNLPSVEAILATSPMAAVAVDRAGVVWLVNPAAERLLGVGKDHGLDGPAAHLLGLFGQEGPLEAAVRAGVPACEERFYHRADGAVLDLRVDARPLADEAGEACGACAWLTDLTEPHAVEAGMRQAEVSLRAFLDHTPELVAIHRGGRVVYVNPAALKHLGYQCADEIVGRSPLEMVHPDDRALISSRIDQMQRGWPVPLVEERMLRGDGSWLPMNVAALPAFFEGEPAVLVLGIDISDRKRAEAERERALADAQRRAAELECVLRSMVDAVFVCDAQGRLTLANEAGRALLGVSVPPASLSLSDLLRAKTIRWLDGSPALLEKLPLARALTGEVVRQVELRWTSEGRDLTLLTSAAPLRGEGGQLIGAVEVARDVTELAELERLKDEFLLVAAHELRTPVTITKGYAQALLRASSPLVEEEARRQAEAINRGSDRIGRIVQDLLDLSQIHLDRLELARDLVDLAALSREAAQSLADRSCGRIALGELAEAVVIGDRPRLAQVLANLLDNALKYSPEGSPVGLAVRRRGACAVVEVEDRGVGISVERQRRIFERFYRAHTDTPHDRGGMGVGLFLSREIVARHGGSMGFVSEEGRGSTFWLELPLAR